jgi:MYXO-CTERM domain-containing protein
MSRLGAAALFAAACATVTTPAEAAPPEPSGAHPRLWQDAATRAAMKAVPKNGGTGVARAIRECDRVGSDLKVDSKNGYMGFEWGAHASNCAIAYQATGQASHAATGLHFFSALLDDWEYVGDGKGGDTAVRHDSGYAIRAVGVHAAITYDFLHDAPGMTPALLSKARRRFKAWTDWYYASGYRSKSPATNYHAGYLAAVTLIAIAQGGEAGADGAALWRHVTEQVWGKEMKAAAIPGGLLDGGDWGEGWQYGPLAVVSYAAAARAMIVAGMPLPDFERWAEQLVLRHVHALSPSEKGTFAGGDTQDGTPSIAPNPWTLVGAIAGPSPDPAAGWARAELDRLHLVTKDQSFLIFDVLAETRNVGATPFPRDATPTFFLSRGNGTLYARSTWSPQATWMAMQCTRTIEVDHLPPNAGNFVLTRGADELVVDPSPYGSLSSLTSNAPTVESAQLPGPYLPSQGYWSEKTGYAWARQTESAIVTARCDYADHYRFQERPSDVPMAMRDVVLVPSENGNASAVVVDRARTGSAARALHLRFRSTASLALEPAGARGITGRSSLAIAPVFTSSGAPVVRRGTVGDCFGKDTTRGNCAAARFAVQDYVLDVNGGDALAIHVLDLADASETLSVPRATRASDHRVVSFERGRRRASVVIAEPGERSTLTYRAAPGHHVVLDAPGARTGRATVTATRDGALCAVTVSATPSGGMDARPLALTVSESCSVTEDATQTRPVSATLDGVVRANGPLPRPSLFPPPAPEPQGGGAITRGARGGCRCDVARGGASSAAAGLVVVGLGLLVSRRRRRR